MIAGKTALRQSQRGRPPSPRRFRVDAPSKERARDRVLSDDELRWLWRACEKIDWPFGPLVKLLLLTGQRRDEVATLQWSELDLGQRTWTLPREKAKNNRAQKFISRMPHRSSGVPAAHRRACVLSTGSTAVSGFSRGSVGWTQRCSRPVSGPWH